VVSPKAAAHQSRVLAEWMNGFDCSFHHQFCTHID
jgi:hypothetical protein